jgi:hypothetical protein
MALAAHGPNEVVAPALFTAPISHLRNFSKLIQLFVLGYWWVTIKSAQEALGLSDATVGAQSAIILNVLTAVLFTDPLFDLVKRLVCCKKAPQGGDDNTTRFLDH